MKKQILLLLVLFTILANITTCNNSAKTECKEIKKVKNVIFFIGDGMGLQIRRIASICKFHNADQKLLMESFTTSGVVYNHSLNYYVTDSAAAGTSLSTGYKTRNGKLCCQGKDNMVTILEACKNQKNMATGLITDTPITHATPASFASHVPSRRMNYKIAEQYLKNKVDLLMGGGKRYFFGRDSIYKKYEKAGYDIVYDRNTFLKLDVNSQKKVLGLFAKSDMAYEIDRDKSKEPSLSEMTDFAIKKLSKNKNGFFLMVEGGKIDWANHGHDAAAAVRGIIELDKAIEVAMKFCNKNSDTLIIQVNDHETGGVTLSKRFDFNAINKIKVSSPKLASLIKKDIKNAKKIFSECTGIKNLTSKELKLITDEATGKIKYSNVWGYRGSFVSDIINKRLGVLYSTSDHSGSPIVLGANHRIFDGYYDATDVPKKIAKLLNIKDFPKKYPYKKTKQKKQF